MKVTVKKAKSDKYLNVSFDLIEYPEEGDNNDFYDDPLKYHLELQQAIVDAVLEYRKKHYKKANFEFIK